MCRGRGSSSHLVSLFSQVLEGRLESPLAVADDDLLEDLG